MARIKGCNEQVPKQVMFAVCDKTKAKAEFQHQNAVETVKHEFLLSERQTSG